MTVSGTNGEDEFPLLKEFSVGGQERIARVVDARGLGGGAVEFDDLEIAAFSQIIVGGVANVIAADEEAVEPLRNLVDAPLKLLRPQVRAIAEDAALGGQARG